MAKNLIYMSVFNKLKRLFDIREHFLLDCIVITIHNSHKVQTEATQTHAQLNHFREDKSDITLNIFHFSGQVWSHVQEAEREG